MFSFLLCLPADSRAVVFSRGWLVRDFASMSAETGWQLHAYANEWTFNLDGVNLSVVHVVRGPHPGLRSYANILLYHNYLEQKFGMLKILLAWMIV